MKLGYVLAAALLLPAAAHADCRSAIGGLYSFAHGGKKIDGTFHAGHAFFSIGNDGTITLMADINDQEHNPAFFSIDGSGPWQWLYPANGPGQCWMHIGTQDENNQMNGYVSDDGRMISIYTIGKEMMWGTAVRDTP